MTNEKYKPQHDVKHVKLLVAIYETALIQLEGNPNLAVTLDAWKQTEVWRLRSFSLVLAPAERGFEFSDF